MSGPRAIWKGTLQISLVQVPIKVYPATEASATLAFNQLHASCQSRIQQKKWCPTCKCEVTAADLVKGFEFEKGKYVLVLDAELDAVAPDSTRVIDVTQFADERALDSLYVDRTYYLAPDGPNANYGVIADAMHGKVGVGKLALYGREYLVAVVARGISAPTHQAILMLHTLHHAAEIRSLDELPFGLPWTSERASLELARQLIETFPQRLNLAAFSDDYQTDLRRLIDTKIAGEEIVVPAIAPSPAVLTLKAALEQSLALVEGKQHVAKARRRSSTALPAATASRKRAG